VLGLVIGLHVVFGDYKSTLITSVVIVIDIVPRFASDELTM